MDIISFGQAAAELADQERVDVDRALDLLVRALWAGTFEKNGPSKVYRILPPARAGACLPSADDPHYPFTLSPTFVDEEDCPVPGELIAHNRKELARVLRVMEAMPAVARAVGAGIESRLRSVGWGDWPVLAKSFFATLLISRPAFVAARKAIMNPAATVERADFLAAYQARLAATTDGRVPTKQEDLEWAKSVGLPVKLLQEIRADIDPALRRPRGRPRKAAP